MLGVLVYHEGRSRSGSSRLWTLQTLEAESASQGVMITESRSSSKGRRSTLSGASAAIAARILKKKKNSFLVP